MNSGNGRKAAWEATHCLNIIPGKFNAKIKDIQIKEPEEINKEKENLKTRFGALKQSLAIKKILWRKTVSPNSVLYDLGKKTVSPSGGNILFKS